MLHSTRIALFLTTSLSGSAALALLTPRASNSLASCLTVGDNQTVYTPGQPGFSTASLVFNQRLNFTPDAIAYPTTVQEVASAVLCGAQQGINVTARSGGHSYAAYGVGGENNHLVIDLSNLKEITYDPSTQTAVVQTGNRLGELAQKLWTWNQALPFGTCPYVGVGGHAAYGGFGLWGRKEGLLLDRAIAAEVVIANGTIITASNTSNSDLFWALRGAAPSFGIVTAWTFKTIPAPSSLINYEIDFPTGQVNSTHALQILEAFQSFAFSNPDPNLSALLPFGYSNSKHLNMIIFGTYFGTQTAFENAIAPLMSALSSIKPTITAQPPTDWYNGTVYQTGPWNLTTPEAPDTFFAKSVTVNSTLTSTLTYSKWINWILANSAKTSIGWFVQIDMYGGAIAQVPNTATAYANRNDVLNFQLYGTSGDSPFPYGSGLANGITFMDELLSTLQNPVVHAYPNYIDPTLTESQWQSQYFGGNMKKLITTKSKWDPRNIFKFPQSIPVSW